MLHEFSVKNLIELGSYVFLNLTNTPSLSFHTKVDRLRVNDAKLFYPCSTEVELCGKHITYTIITFLMGDEPSVQTTEHCNSY